MANIIGSIKEKFANKEETVFIPEKEQSMEEVSQPISVFLGGTCADSTWRQEIMPSLNKNIQAFNPVTPNWTPECQAEEDKHKAQDDVNLFYLTPESNSLYSMTEIMRSAINDTGRTMVCIQREANGKEYTPEENQQMDLIEKKLKQYGAIVCNGQDDVTYKLNHFREMFHDRKDMLSYAQRYMADKEQGAKGIPAYKDNIRPENIDYLRVARATESSVLEPQQTNVAFHGFETESEKCPKHLVKAVAKIQKDISQDKQKLGIEQDSLGR